MHRTSYEQCHWARMKADLQDQGENETAESSWTALPFLQACLNAMHVTSNSTSAPLRKEVHERVCQRSRCPVRVSEVQEMQRACQRSSYPARVCLMQEVGVLVVEPGVVRPPCVVHVFKKKFMKGCVRRPGVLFVCQRFRRCKGPVRGPLAQQVCASCRKSESWWSSPDWCAHLALQLQLSPAMFSD